MIDKEYNKILKQYHKLSDRHILVVETDMSSSDIQTVIALCDRIRKAGNELVGLIRKSNNFKNIGIRNIGLND